MTPVRLAFLSLAIASASTAQSPDSSGWTRHVVTSKKLGEDRPVLVSTPPGYNEKSRDGVVVLLDGNDDIQREAARANVRFLANRGAIQPLIIVAVPNTKDRWRGRALRLFK